MMDHEKLCSNCQRFEICKPDWMRKEMMDQGIKCDRYVPFGCLIVKEEPRSLDEKVRKLCGQTIKGG